MTELASTIVAILASYLSSGRPPEVRAPGQAPGAAESLYALVSGRLANDDSLRTLAQEASTGSPRPRTEQRVELALADALESDPGFAARAESLARQAQPEQTTAGGASSNVNEQRVAFDHVRANRINNKVTNRSKNTKIAVGGGGALLAGALLFVWLQYSAGQAAADERDAYQKGVIATCERIRQTGTGQLNPQPESGGLSFRRAELEHLMSVNEKVVQGQVRSLLTRPAPDGLDDERAAVERAAAASAAAYPRAMARIRQLPSTFPMEVFLSLPSDPTFGGFVDAYRTLGDALTRLGGSTCAIEFQPQQGR